MTTNEQIREILAALSLNRTQLSKILGISRSTLYDWLNGEEPNPHNEHRISRLVSLLSVLGISSNNPINQRFVPQNSCPGWGSLFVLLSDHLQSESKLIASMEEAHALSEQSRSRIHQHTLEFDEPTMDQKRENLNLNMSLLDWPKG